MFQSALRPHIRAVVFNIKDMNKNEFNFLKWKYSRYLFFLKYATAVKFINLLQCFFSWLRNKETISTYPAFLRVEISRWCTVNCIYCNEPKEKIFYPFELFEQLVNSLKKHLLVVSLYEIGEPLENRYIIKYIKCANTNNIGTIICTNLSIEKDDSFWKELVASGLDKIVVAIDGISDDIYNAYRTNGNLQLVFSNLKKIIHYKKLLRSTLRIEWQMIDFDWNKSEQLSARRLSNQLGCDEFRIIPNAYRKRFWSESKYVRKKNCIHPYFTFLVNAYNKVRPCPVVYNVDVTIGDLNTESFDEIWNGAEIRKTRSKKKIQYRNGCKTCRS